MDVETQPGSKPRIEIEDSVGDKSKRLWSSYLGMYLSKVLGGSEGGTVEIGYTEVYIEGIDFVFHNN